MRDKVVEVLSGELGWDIEKVGSLVEVAPNLSMGDFAFPCFGLTKEMKKAPGVIAFELASKIKVGGGIERVEANGGYLNFFVDRVLFCEDVFGREFGELDFGKGKRVVVEFSSPNIAKPFGIGHLRSTIIGNSLAKISEACGFEVFRVNYLGDWGAQFGKIIWGYKKWIKDKTEKDFEKDPIGKLQNIYVQANKYDNEKNKKDVDEMRNEFRKLEEGDEENLVLWRKFRDFSLREFQKIYDFMGISFDEVGGESFYRD